MLHRTVLKLDGQGSNNGFLKSELIHRPWSDIGSNHTAKIYRYKILMLHGIKVL